MTRIAGKSPVAHRSVSSGCGSTPARKPTTTPKKPVSTACGAYGGKVETTKQLQTVSTSCGGGGRKTVNLGCG